MKNVAEEEDRVEDIQLGIMKDGSDWLRERYSTTWCDAAINNLKQILVKLAISECLFVCELLHLQ